MAITAVPAKVPVEIPYSLVEYTAKFEKPIVNVWDQRAAIIANVLSALQPWGFTLEGVEIKTRSEKLSEHGVVFRRTIPQTPAMSLALTFGTIFISAANLDWTEADDFVSAMMTGISAIRESFDPTISSQQVALGMHIQLKAGSVKDVTTPLLSASAAKLMDGGIKTAGIILMREKSSILIDASAAYANALFVRIIREHSADALLPEMAERLRQDEEQLFDVLSFEGER
jgi:hypothetical protein